MTLQKLIALQRKLQHPSQIGRSGVDLITDIPNDLEKFYESVGHFTNQKTDQPVLKLAPHQIESWNDRKRSKYRLYLKSQKIGLSTMILLEDLHAALTYATGKEILIVSQSKDKAREHLQDLRKMILNSVYKSHLIDRKRSDEDLLRDEQTKVDIIYLRNPKNPIMPTKIVALGITSPSSLISYKRVAHVHMSDITLADMVEARFDESFGGVFSRLANTDGTMVIECPPRGTSGPVYKLAEGTLSSDDGIVREIDEGAASLSAEGFLIRRYTYRVGIACGMITPGFVEKERNRLGPLFSMYYEAEFFSGNVTWYDRELIKYSRSSWTVNAMAVRDDV